jgi:hypothetical protein
MGILARGIVDLVLDYVYAWTRVLRWRRALAATAVIPAFILASSAVVLVGRSINAAGAVRPGGVNVEPSMRPWRYVGANPQSWWCVLPNCTADFSSPSTTIQTELSDAKNAGATNVRLEFPWWLIEPQRGVYDWSRADLIMSEAASTGITIQPVLVWSPSWTAAAPNQPPAAADMHQFAHDFTLRYDGRVPVIEIWNEPDSGNYLFNGSASTYVASILNPAYAGIKSVDTSVRVELGGPANDAGTCCPFLSAVIADGGNFDIAAFHNYVGTGLSEAIAYARITSKPIWLGEYGAQSSSCAAGSDCQSQLINSTLTTVGPLAMAQWYNLRDTGAWNCCPPALGASATWGLLNSNFSAKASYSTMQSLLRGAPDPPPSPSSSPLTSPSPSPRPSPTPGPQPSPSPTPPPPSPSPLPSPSPSPTPGPVFNSGPTIFSDTFVSDPIGSTPFGWRSSGFNSTWTVNQATTADYITHGGWSGDLTTGSPTWSDYVLTTAVLPSCWGSESDRVLFGVQDSGRYSLDIVGGTRVVLTRKAGATSTQLASAAFACNPNHWYRVQIRWTRTGAISVSLDGSQMLNAVDTSWTAGAIGFESNDPFAFGGVLVQTAT